MTQLKQIPVLFNQEEHTYTNTETSEMLKGITSTLIHRLFPDKYSGIPQAVLARAAERGTAIHEEIELVETIGIAPSTEESRNYIKLKEEHGLNFLESEYTVSDLEHYATNIDAIYEVEENVVDIADFKTTSKFDDDSVSWQLSICAYLLELNNPHVKVRDLFGIWLRGDIAQLIPVERRTDEEVRALMEADINGKEFEYSPALPDYIRENMTTLYCLGKRIKELTEEYDSIKAEVQAKMAENKEKSFKTDKVLFSLIAPSVRTSFDSKRFMEENGELAKKYTTSTTTKETLKITLR